MNREQLIAEAMNNRLIDEAIRDFVQLKKPTIQFKYIENNEWRSFEADTPMGVLVYKQVEWRRKPEPVVHYHNVYRDNTLGSARSTREQADMTCNPIASENKRVGVVCITFEKGKDPTFEFVKA